MNHEVLIVLWRDPYIGLLQSIYIWGLYNPLYKLNNLGFGHCSLVFSKYDSFCLLQQNANVTSFFMCISSQVGFHPKTKQDIHEKFPSFLRGAFYFRNFPSWRCPSYGKNKTKHPFATRPCNLRNHPKRSSSLWLGSLQSQWEWPRWSFSFSTGIFSMEVSRDKFQSRVEQLVGWRPHPWFCRGSFGL